MRERLFQILHDFEGKRVLIIGDLMLDRYYWGQVDKISPEAPVPIVLIKKESYVPGGAANTANNCSALGGNTFISGVIGKDNAGNMLKNELEKRKINVKGIVKSEDRPTIQKIRVMGGKQQLARIDYEDTSYVGDTVQKQILDYVVQNISEVDAIIFSDYAKGLVSKEFIRKIIKLAKQNKKPTIADVKPKHISFFKGVTVITPNKKEAAEMSGIIIKSEKDMIRAGKKLVKDIDTNVLITLGSDGMALFKKDGSIQKFPVKAQEVFDVSGAGDTVVAALTLAIAAGAKLEEAVILSNYAAGVVIGKLGTATTTIDEIKDSMKQNLSIKNKIKTREELAQLIPKLKKQGKKVGFTSGAFDIIHAGHITYLEDAKKICDILIIGLNTDASVKKYKGENRPINNQEDRLKIISALEPVDFVFLFNDRRNNVNIETLKPDFYIKGGDYSPDTLTSKPVVEKYGGEAVVLPIVKGKSTTEMIKKLMIGEKTSSVNEIKHTKVSQAVFIDRDGVINKEVSYLHNPEKFEFLPNVLEGMKKMQDMGFKIIVVTNQAGIGLGYFTKEDFYKVNRVMLKGVSKAGIMIDKIYFCPHGINDDCDCRKPKSGMLLRGKEELNLDMKNSYMIGDMTSDIKAGENAGTKTILVKTGYGGKEGGDTIKSNYVAEDLVDAAEFILKDQRNL